MRSHQIFGMLAMTALLGMVGPADARADEKMCVREARETQAECRAACRDDFLVERDLCRDIDPACGEACRTAYNDCKAPFIDILTSCKNGCRATFVAERDACPSAADPARDACVDEAQVRAFVCRDECRENRDVRSGRKSCRQARNSCIRACPPPGTGTPPPRPDPGLG